MAEEEVRKTYFWGHLYIKTPSFYQDRLRTNIGKALKKVPDGFLQERRAHLPVWLWLELHQLVVLDAHEHHG